MNRFFIGMTFFLLGDALLAAPTNQPVASTITVTVNENGNLIAPTNFFSANLALMSSAGLAESVPAALKTSSTYPAWTNGGGSYAAPGPVAESPLLTNGFASISYAYSGSMILQTEMSNDSNIWVSASATNTAVYLRLSAAEGVPMMGPPSLIISNIVISSWTYPDLFANEADTVGQIILSDTPTQPRQVVNKSTLDQMVAAKQPTNWSEYVATDNVRLDGKSLIMTAGWTLYQTGGVGIVSYADVWATTNALTVAHNGIAMLTAQSGITGLHIDDFSIVASNVILWVSTNGVVSEPLPQYTEDLLLPNWQTIAVYISSYPTVTNSAYKIDFDLPESETGFFRVVQQTGTGLVNIDSSLNISGKVVSPTHYFLYESETNWIGAWADFDAYYQGLNSNGTLIVHTNKWVPE